MSALQKQMRFTVNSGFILESETFSGFDGLYIKDPTVFEHEGNQY
jgi:hypothetical protein